MHSVKSVKKLQGQVVLRMHDGPFAVMFMISKVPQACVGLKSTYLMECCPVQLSHVTGDIDG